MMNTSSYEPCALIFEMLPSSWLFAHFFCEITVEQAASVLIRTLHCALDLAHRQEISPVLRVQSSLRWFTSKIILF